MFKNFFLRKFCHLRDNVEKYGRARQATDDNINSLRKFTVTLKDAVLTNRRRYTRQKTLLSQCKI